MGAYWPSWRAHEANFSWSSCCAAFKIMLPTEGGEHFFEKWWMFCKKRCLNHEWHKENCRSHTNFAKLEVRCIQSFLLTGLWRLKMHKSWAIIKILKGARSEKRANRTSQGTIRASKSDKSSSYEGRLGVKKVKISIEIAWSRFAKSCSPCRQEAHFWKNVMQKVN